jgi:tripartite-type tricarboxylate transporter receptor subunit TctC
MVAGMPSRFLRALIPIAAALLAAGAFAQAYPAKAVRVIVPEEFGAFLAAEVRRYAQVIRDAGIKVD